MEQGRWWNTLGKGINTLIPALFSFGKLKVKTVLDPWVYRETSLCEFPSNPGRQHWRGINLKFLSTHSHLPALPSSLTFTWDLHQVHDVTCSCFFRSGDRAGAFGSRQVHCQECLSGEAENTHSGSWPEDGNVCPCQPTPCHFPSDSPRHTPGTDFNNLITPASTLCLTLWSKFGFPSHALSRTRGMSMSTSLRSII